MIKIALTNLGKYNEGYLIYEWLEMPFTDEELAETLEKIGINEEYEEYFITDFETDITGLTIGEYENLEELNELAEQLENMEEWEIKKIAAILEYEVTSLKEAIETIEEYQLYENITNDEDLGYMYGEELVSTETLGIFENYIDYEAFGRDCRFNEGGAFTENGYIFRC